MATDLECQNAKFYMITARDLTGDHVVKAGDIVIVVNGLDTLSEHKVFAYQAKDKKFEHPMTRHLFGEEYLPVGARRTILPNADAGDYVISTKTSGDVFTVNCTNGKLRVGS